MAGKTKRMFVSASGRWYVVPDKNGRLSIPRIFTCIDLKKGYRFYQSDDKTIVLEPNINFPVLSQLCIPSIIRRAMQVSGGNDVFEIKPRENGEGFTLTLCKEGDII